MDYVIRIRILCRQQVKAKIRLCELIDRYCSLYYILLNLNKNVLRQTFRVTARLL